MSLSITPWVQHTPTRHGKRKNASFGEQAEHHYKKALEVSPAFVDAAYGLALLQFYVQQKREEGIRTLEELSAQRPAFYRGRFALARFYYEAGDTRKSLAVFENLYSSLEEAHSSPNVREYKRLCKENIDRLMQEMSAPGPPPVTSPEILNAVALSVTAAPAKHSLWELVRRAPASAVYSRLAETHTHRTQDFITHRYPAAPLKAAEAIINNSYKKAVRIITFWDEDYPALLREIRTAPLVLYTLGHGIAGRCVSIVGTRNADMDSKKIARRLGGDLGHAGFTVVSGMAAGVDRAAHLGAIGSPGGTIGVLANGIDIAYPAQNRDIYESLQEDPASLLISEYPPGIRAGKWTFVRRNRIISGLSYGTVVVQGR